MGKKFTYSTYLLLFYIFSIIFFNIWFCVYGRPYIIFQLIDILICVYLLLQPRKFKFKSRQKKRSKSSWSENKLTYGDIGLFTTNPLMLSSKQIFRLKIFLKKAVRRSDYTKRLVWFNVFPHLPLSRKTKGMRMGKGAGKLSTWFIKLKAGKSVLEFRNLRFGRAKYFLKQVSFKLPTKTIIYSKKTRFIKLSSISKVNANVRTFW